MLGMCFIGTPIPRAWITLSIVSLQGSQKHSGCMAVLSSFTSIASAFSKFLALVNCACTFATMIYNPPSANPAVDSKLLVVIIHLASGVGKLIKMEPIIPDQICNNYSTRKIIVLTLQIRYTCGLNFLFNI